MDLSIYTVYICVCMNQTRICNIYSSTNKAVWNKGKHNRETMWMFRRIPNNNPSPLGVPGMVYGGFPKTWCRLRPVPTYGQWKSAWHAWHIFLHKLSRSVLAGKIPFGSPKLVVYPTLAAYITVNLIVYVQTPIPRVCW